MSLRRRFSIIPVLILLLALVSPLFPQAPEALQKSFPLPKVLEPNVQFWKNVYAKYSERQVIIHDSWDLSIVYDVVNLDSLFRGVSVSPRIEWKRIEQIKKRYKRLLLRLASRGRIDVKKLRGEEKQVASLFGPKVTAKQLRIASKRIRGQSGLRERFQKGLIRSGQYLADMKVIFQEAGLPLELLALPHVESSFNYKAYSKLGAAGLWQFTRSTGRNYMLVNYNVDERLDPITSTRSAAKHLKKNFEVLRSWPLAVTAYNHGRNGMRRAKRKFGTDIGKIVSRYSSRSFGFASRNFYSEFLAALYISNNYQEFFPDLQVEPSQKYVEFNLPHYVTVRTLLTSLGLKMEEFSDLNPALRQPVLSSRRRIPKNFIIRVPHQDNFDIERLYAQIAPQYKYQGQVEASWHKVQSGENLSSIARRYRVRMSDLMAANNIRDAHRIRVGQNLQIPGRSGPRESAAVVAARPKTAEAKLADATTVAPETENSVLDVPRTIRLDRPKQAEEPRVATRDKVTSIPPKGQLSKKPEHPLPAPIKYQKIEDMGQRHLTMAEVMAMALPDHHVEVDRNMNIRVVRDAKVEDLHESFRNIEMPENGQVRIEPDETLGHFADWLQVPTHKLRRINGLSYQTLIRVGQPLWLTFEKVTPEELHRRRVEFHQGIEEDFYRNFQVQGETPYRVRRGDNLWIICNQRFELPHWLLKKYNPDVELGSLQVGQEIMVPIVEPRYPQDVVEPPR